MLLQRKTEAAVLLAERWNTPEAHILIIVTVKNLHALDIQTTSTSDPYNLYNYTPPRHLLYQNINFTRPSLFLILPTPVSSTLVF